MYTYKHTFKLLLKFPQIHQLLVYYHSYHYIHILPIFRYCLYIGCMLPMFNGLNVIDESLRYRYSRFAQIYTLLSHEKHNSLVYWNFTIKCKSGCLCAQLVKHPSLDLMIHEIKLSLPLTPCWTLLLAWSLLGILFLLSLCPSPSLKINK